MHRLLASLVLSVGCLLLPGCDDERPEARLQSSQTIDLLDGSLPDALAIVQEQGQSLLVAIHAYETELESSFRVEDSPPFSTIHIPSLRLVPHFQLLEAPDSERTIQLQLTPLSRTRNSRVRVDVLQPANASPKLRSAYARLADAVQKTSSDSRDDWVPRVAWLQEASEQFEDLGMKEEGLWSKSLQAYFLYHPVYDYSEAIRLSREAYKEAAREGFDEIALVALQILAFSLIERNESDSPAKAEEKQAEAQLLFQQAAALADQYDMRFEKAWAINGQGIGFFYQDRLEQALERYERALPMAIELNDVTFANLVRGNIALTQERLGREAEALETLGEISASFTEATDAGQVIENLVEQGRIYKNLNQFSGSVTVLTKAMELAEGRSATNALGRIRVSLARAYYEMGLMDRAEAHLAEAEPALIDTNQGRGLRELYLVKANIHRNRSEFDLMEVARARQGDYLLTDTDRAYYAYYQAGDLMARNTDLEKAQQYLRQSAEQAESLTDVPLQQQLRLERCLNSLRLSQRENECNLPELYDDFAKLAAAAAPREALSGMESWARILTRLGSEAEALQAFEELVGRIAFYRLNLPGVLGAWYWERRKSIFDAYMGLVLKSDLAQGEGTDSLVIFNRLRNLDAAVSPRTLDVEPLNEEQEARFRSILAQRAKARTTDQVEALNREYDRLRLEIKQGAPRTLQRLDRTGLEARLAALSPEESVMAFYFGTDGIYAWTADHAGVRLTRIPGVKDLRDRLDELVTAARLGDRGRLRKTSEELGTQLLDPLPPMGSTIYLLPAGPLNGVPFDLLDFGGEPLGRRHSLIQLMSLEALGSDAASQPAPQRVFLAGDPVGDLDGLPQLVAAGGELDFVAGLYTEAQVELATRSDLTLESFRSAEFAQADLVHIASHAEVDLAYPSRSTIRLSDSANAAADLLTPLDFQGISIAANLIVLSACETSGASQFSFDANLGFVTAFLAAGARAVVATLWPVPDRATAEFMQDFYIAFSQGSSAETALHSTKSKWIERGRSDQAIVWAAFQIYRN